MKLSNEELSEKFRNQTSFTTNPEKFYSYLILKIEHEDNLINHRTTWALTLQGLLFASISLLLAADRFLSNSLSWQSWLLLSSLTVSIPIVGLVSARALHSGVSAAKNAIVELKHQWQYRLQTQNIGPADFPHPYWAEDGLGVKSYNFPFWTANSLFYVWSILLALSILTVLSNVEKLEKISAFMIETWIFAVYFFR